MLSLMKKRRSIRTFQDKKVEKEKINAIIRTALLSPSSKNNNPWKFIVVEDKEILAKLSHTKNVSQFLRKAPLGIVVLADPQQSDVWIEDASIVTTIIILAAQKMDLGSCWIQVRERKHADEKSAEEFVKELLKIPENLRVLCMVAVGYPDEVKPEKEIDKRKLDDVFLNLFDNIMTIHQK